MSVVARLDGAKRLVVTAGSAAGPLAPPARRAPFARLAPLAPTAPFGPCEGSGPRGQGGHGGGTEPCAQPPPGRVPAAHAVHTGPRGRSPRTQVPAAVAEPVGVEARCRAGDHVVHRHPTLREVPSHQGGVVLSHLGGGDRP